MFDFDIINEYQIEVTTYCNAACPQCPRNNNGSGVNPYLTLEHLPKAVIDSAFDAKLCNRLRQVFFCGSYGDPIMHPDFLDILRDFRRKCPTLWLYLHTNGYDITKDLKSIAEMSLKYDVFINNAFDGPPHEVWANFAQAQVYMAVYDAWKSANKTGYIFNIGSSGSKNIVAPEPRFETYRVSKAALEHASKQGTQAFKHDLVLFKTTLITLDRLDTELSRSRPTWTGNGINLTDISNFIQYATAVSQNTVVEEATFYVNLDHKA